MSTPETQARILRALEAATDKLEADERRRSEPIAIVGLGCRFPGADGPDEFWALLRDGVDAVGEFPPERWNIDEYFDADRDAAGRTYARAGGFLRHIDRFDAGCFGISPREAESMDPQHRILLETAAEAFEHAGLTRSALRGSRTGVFVGITSCDYSRQIARALDRLDSYYVTGNTLNAAAGRIAYLFGLRGPSLAVDTACSSSLVAVHLACQSLRARECETALAAGVNLILSPEGLIALSKSRVLSADGRCRTFDAAADGMGRGEGCGVLILKRLSDAERDGDSIAALIRGTAINQDGASSGLTVPNGPAQEDVIRLALENARLTPDAVSYIETHGTGTPLGDPIELGALAQVFGPGRPAGRPLFIGAVKANIAHGESSAGMAGLIKTTLCLQQRAIPPQLHFHTPSSHVDWASAPFSVPTTLTPWTAGPRIAGVSGFGFSGTNAHVVLEEAPGRPVPADASELGGPAVLPLSAADPAALIAAAGRYAVRLQVPGTRLEDVCFSAGTRRDHHPHRLAAVGTTVEEMSDALGAFAHGRETAAVRRGEILPARAARVVFMFSGQGVQSAEMGSLLAAHEPAFRDAVDRCASVLGRDPLGSAGAAINDTAHAQPAIFTFEYALATLWQSWGVVPSAVIGHSVGEYVAACIAGVLTLEDALAVVAERGRLMSALPQDGGMFAALAPESVVSAIAASHADRLSIAAINGPDNTVVSGERTALALAVASLERDGIVCKPLTVSHAFHSPLMEPMLLPFRAVLEGVALHRPGIAFYSNLTGLRATDEVTSADYWVEHVRQPVRFAEGIAAAYANGHRVFLEIGPHPVLTVLGRVAVAGDLARWIPSGTRGVDERTGVRLALAELFAAGASIDWHAVYPQGRCVELPTYPFQRKRYWFLESPSDSASPSAVARELFTIDWVDAPPITAGRDRVKWLILGDTGGIGEQLATRIRREGGTADLHTSLEQLVSAVARHGDASALRIAHMASLDIGPGTAWDDAQRIGCHAALDVIRAAAARSGARVWVITRGAQAADNDGVAVLQASLWGLGRVAALEHPASWGGLIDLPPHGNVDVDLLLAELQAASEPEVVHRAGGRLVPRLTGAASPALPSTAFDRTASYIVTGAFGALGLQTAEWMVSRGARRLVLTGRREPSANARARVDALISSGASVHVVLADVGDAAAASRIVHEADALGRLRGIVHAAGALDDGLLADLNATRFTPVMNGKARGAFNLDVLTRGRGLDFFVMFSSLSSVLGSPGQGNYAAANATLDAIAADRRSSGDAALSINWGPWSGGGMAEAVGATLRARGLTAWSPEEAVQLLGKLLTSDAAQLVAARMKPAAIRASMPDARLAMLDRLAPPVAPDAPGAVHAFVPPSDRGGMLAYLCTRIERILRLDGGPATTRSLQEQGLDSMMATELRNRITRELGLDIPLARFLSGATIEELADALCRQAAVNAVSTVTARTDDAEELVL